MKRYLLIVAAAGSLVFSNGCSKLSQTSTGNTGTAPNSNAAVTSNVNTMSGTPIFTAQELMAQLKAKGDEFNISMKGKDIRVGGTVSMVTSTEVTFFAGGVDKVICTPDANSVTQVNTLIAYAREFAQGISHYPPTAAGKGTYKDGIIGSGKMGTTIYVANCEIYGASRL